MLLNKGKQIIDAIRTGNNELVLNHLYKDILPGIKRMILKNSGSEEDAKDIFQDAVLIFYNHVKLNKFDDNKDIGAFIYAVSRNLWINKAKRSNKFIQIQQTDNWEELDANVLNDLITEEKAAAIEQLMNGVGEECKKLLRYSVYEKLSMKEISVKMGYSSEGVAKTYHYRCKQKLVNLVKDNTYIISLFKD